MSKKRDLVYYCPGNAGGSPATMERSQAELQLEKDTAELRGLERVNAAPDPIHLPHIGGKCPCCKSD